MLRIIEITDFKAPELDVYARCSEKQLLIITSRTGALSCGKSQCD